MSEESTDLRHDPHGRAWPLYGAAFMMAISLSVAWTAMPFVLSYMGGTPAHVGYAPAVNNLAYMIALLVTGSRFGHLRVRRTTLSAATVALTATAVMSLCVLWTEFHAEARGLVWIWALIVAGGVGGSAMALYWPFLMSWVSADYEGMRLNRRFGRYNGAWSGGATIGPLIGGWLFEINAVLPLAAAAVSVLLSLLLLSFGRDGTAGRAGQSQAAGVKEISYDMHLLADCRWMSRVALFSVCASYAILRSQFALVFRDLGYAESQFGMYLTVYALCNCAALMAAGRWAQWHFKPALLPVGQVLLLVVLLLTIYGRTLSVFLVSSVLLGAAYGFAYSSHLYYGASASRRRSARMAIHEIAISLGLTIGSFAGGYLAQHVGLYAPYWFAVGLVGLGGGAQIVIYRAARARVGPVSVPAAGHTQIVEP
ncbi:MAG: MFS transporter [Planctomycetes bacterium]|nr:MFS transporter [Planctomycetota bacterium]